MKIGIISFANKKAWEYARCIKEMGLEFVGISDDAPDRGRKASEALTVPYFPNKKELLSQPLDLVIICSENAKHKEDIILSAQAKKHILCETPLAISLEDVHSILETCEENNVFLIPAFPLRYSPPLQRAKELIEVGQIGEISALKATIRSKVPKGWQIEKRLAGGGAILQNAIHMIDVMRWLIKEEVVEVYAEVSKNPHLNLEVEDIANLSMRFKNEVFATLDPSWCYPSSFPFWGDAKIDIIGREGTLIVDAFAQVLSYAREKENTYSWRYWGSDIHQLMLKDALKHLLEGKQPPLSALDGLKALETALGAYLSWEKGEPVSL